MTNPNCQADDCTNQARSRSAQYCEKHYYRLRRTGSLTVKREPVSNVGKQCSAEGCEETARTRGLCRKHYIRLWRHDDASVVIAHGERAYKRGADSPQWAGDAITYFGFHRRLSNLKGPASTHACADCGSPARQWSYDREDPDEQVTDAGPYSTDPDHYAPRCVPCHKRFDLARLKAADGERSD